MTTALNYSASDIKVLEGLEAVRKRPGMYIGSTGTRGLHHLVHEVIDNAVDEALAGWCKQIKLILEPENIVTIVDDGRGIPTGMHETGQPTPVVVYTKLHAGGKFGGSSYKVSGGLHGVGAAVVNALSEWVEVTIYRNSTIHKVRFSEGGQKYSDLEQLGNTRKRGTTVRFKPDTEIFGKLNFNFQNFLNRCRELAFLVPGLEFTLIDKTREDAVSVTFKYDGGISDFVRFLNESRGMVHKPVHFKGKAEDIEVEVAFQYNDGYSESLVSFVNCINTVEGGYHETGFKSAHTRTMNEYARKLGIWKKKDNLAGEDLREGMMAVLSLKMPEVEFEGQTKTKLGNSEARAAVEQVMAEHLAAFLEENPDLATTLIERASNASEARHKARKVREATRKGKGRSFRSSLDGKLTRCSSRDPLKCELFIVEGDSAGGSAKQGRDRKFQAILPLRGKPLNTERAPLERILRNNEFAAIVQTLGAGIGQDFRLESLRYHKIIMLSDADDDGAHIRCLLLTFFYRFMRPLITSGKIYIACPPLFRVFNRKDSQYAYSIAEMQELKAKMGKHAAVQRFKGLGEMNADQLWDTTIDPEKRTLLQITIDDASNAERSVSVLMGANSEPRRDWIVDNVEFGLEDEIPE